MHAVHMNTVHMILLVSKDVAHVACSLPTNSIRAMMIVWRLGGKIIRTVLCCVVYDSCAQ